MAATCHRHRSLSEVEIGLDATQSKPAWPMRVVPPKGAPNILLIMTDDVGFGAPSTFGGVIPTPALDRIAAAGLRYTNFHSTSLCSPTRAALITGRNHHSAGFGVISEAATGFPGYNSIIRKDSATIGRILLENGYRTSWFGKDHNTPTYQPARPARSTNGRPAWDLSTSTASWAATPASGSPCCSATPRDLPLYGHPGWNLITAMADDAIDWLNQLNAIDPAMPFFLYYVPGGTHAPHHPTPEWIKKISDMHLFDKGWNALRDQIFANQKRLGVIPQDAKLTPWPDNLLKTWDTRRRGEEALHPAGGRLRRLSGLHRPRNRPRHPGGRGHGQAGQYADHLHQRRQRCLRRRFAQRHAQRVDAVQRHRTDGRRADEVL